MKCERFEEKMWELKAERLKQKASVQDSFARAFIMLDF